MTANIPLAQMPSAGASVLVRWKDGSEYPAAVVESQPSQCFVRFPDGREVWVEQAYVRLAMPAVTIESPEGSSNSGSSEWTSAQGPIPPELKSLLDEISQGGTPGAGSVFRFSSAKAFGTGVTFTLLAAISGFIGGALLWSEVGA